MRYNEGTKDVNHAYMKLADHSLCLLLKDCAYEWITSSSEEMKRSVINKYLSLCEKRTTIIFCLLIDVSIDHVKRTIREMDKYAEKLLSTNIE